VAQARASVLELAIQHATLAKDAAALEKLALWVLRLYSHLVAAVDAPNRLVIDETGAAYLHGGEDANAVEYLPFGPLGAALLFHLTDRPGRNGKSCDP